MGILFSIGFIGVVGLVLVSGLCWMFAWLRWKITGVPFEGPESAEYYRKKAERKKD